MAFGYTGGATNRDLGTSSSVTHGQTINAGDLVVYYINYNSTDTITPGQTWTGSNVEVPSTETAQQGMYWKIAGASEPSAYTATLGTSAEWRSIVKVFTSATDAEVDVAFSTNRTAGNTQDLVCAAVSGAALSDNCLSVIAGGKDNRSVDEAYTTADNSYVSVLGSTYRACAGAAHRIYSTSPVAPASVIIDVADAADGANDKTYSTHISFVESAAGGGATGKSNPMSGPFGGCFAGPIG